jgi:YggT family protein
LTALAQIVIGLLGMINVLVMIWCLLSWFPNIKWYEQPFKTLDQIVSPILAPFRKVIPPIGAIDISPIVAIMVLNFVGQIVLSVIR